MKSLMMMLLVINVFFRFTCASAAGTDECASAGGTSAATVVAVTAGLASVGFLTTSFDGAPIERQLSDAENTKTVLS